MQIKHIVLVFVHLFQCWGRGPGPHACWASVPSSELPAPPTGSQPMCICFEGRRMNIQCLLRWKMKTGNISDFFALGNYDFGTRDVHGVLQKTLLSCAEPYRPTRLGSSLLPHLKGSHSTLYLGHTLCSRLPTPGSSAQAPEAAG